jgi:hypothetical protein
MSAPENIKPVEVFSGTLWQADIIKDMLMDNDIVAYLGDEIWGMDAPIQTAPEAVGSVSVFVDREDREDAKIVVERYYEEDIMSEGDL